MGNIALIPARGGSKRIPGKNIRNFLGKPIIAYSIEAAKKSKCFDRVIVSTDCPEIKKVALHFGAEVPFERPANISDDYATTNDVIKHSINWLKNNNISFEFLCCLYATAPFIRETDIKLGLDHLSKHANADYALSVTSFPFPIQRAIKIKEGRIEMFSPEYLLTRSQDLEDAYHDAGQFYWGRPGAFLADVPFFSKASIPVILPRHLVQDIDNEEDWIRAERLYKANLQ